MTSNIEQIIDTYTYHDPGRCTIPIGTAAINLQLAAAGLEPPLAASDIDTMASTKVWQDLLNKNLGLDTVKEVHVKRWSPHNSAVVELIPDPAQHPTHLPFSACIYMNDHVPASHASIQDNGKVVDAYGVPCLTLPAALKWKAQIGRPKDQEFLSGVMPVIADAGLLTPEQATELEEEFFKSFGLTILRNYSLVD